MVLDAVDNRKLTALVLLDLSKAYDSINHSLPLTNFCLCTWHFNKLHLNGLKDTY